jgi:hypothetical protein
MSSLSATALKKFNEMLYPEVKKTLKEKLLE